MPKILILILITVYTSLVFSLNLKVGYYNNPPLCYEFNGKAKGFFIDLLSKIAEKEGWNVEYIKTTFPLGLKKIKNRTLDILVDVAEIPERKAWSKFNDITVLSNWGDIYIPINSKIKTIKDLENKSIAVVKNDVYFKKFKELVMHLDIKVNFNEIEGDYSQLFELVKNEKVDGAITSRIFGDLYAEKFDLKSLGLFISPIKLKYMFRKDFDENVIEKIDKYLKDWKENKNSYYYSVFSEYFKIVPKFPRKFVRYIKSIILISISVAAFLFSMVLILQIMVRNRTRKLQEEKEKLAKLQKELEASHQELEAMYEELEITSGELEKSVKKLSDLINLIKDFGRWEISEKDFLKELFDFAIKNIPEADYGSIWFLEENTWKLIKAVGHDERLLKSMELNKNYMYVVDDLRIVDIMKLGQKIRPTNVAKIFEQATKPIKKSLIIPLKASDEYCGIMTLDISKESDKDFSSDSIFLMRSLISLASTFLTLKRILNQMTGLIDLMKFKERETSEEEFLKKLLNYAVKNVPEADYGSVWLVEGNLWKFVAAVGHNEKILRELIIDKKYLYPANGVEVVDIMEFDKKTMPPEIEKKLREGTKPIKKAMIAPLKVGNEFLGNISLDIDPRNPKDFSENSIRLMEALTNLASAFLSIKRIAKIQGRFFKSLIMALVRAVELRDPYTKGHSERVAKLSTSLAEKVGLEKEKIRKIYWCGLVHDLGKILIEDSILNKPGRLTQEEREKIRLHPVFGWEILKTVEDLKDIAEIVLYHHERYDGKGYPTGLKGENIPIESRIISIADAFDAMTSERVYRRAFTVEEALNEIEKGKGTQFDPKLAEIFIQIIKDEYHLK